MPAAKTQLIGGSFQDNEGNVLALGYLRLRLSSDELISGVGQVCAGVVTTINLNSSGSVDTVTPQLVWGNDQMTPVNSFYIVTGYKADGQLAWGPNNEQVIGSGGTFDVGTWIPNTVISWTYPAAYGPTGPTGAASSVAGPTGPTGTGVTGPTGSSGSVTFGASLPSWMMITDGSNYAFDGSNGQFSAGSAGLIKWWMIRVLYPQSVYTASFRYISAGSGGTGAIGLYDSTGQTKLASWDNFAFSGGAGPKTITITGAVPYTINPGLYLMACGQSTGSSSATTQGGYKTQGSSDNTNAWNILNDRSGQAANGMTGSGTGFMPSSLGSLSLTTGLGTSLPCVCLEPQT